MANFVTYEQMQIIASQIGNNFNTIHTTLNETQDTITDEFNATVNYKVGDVVVYNNTLYKCSSPHNAGEWDSANFTATTVAELINEARVRGSYNNEALFIH